MLTRRADTLALLTLAALTVVFFWKLALTNLILVGVDIFTYFYPYRAVVNESLARGHLPLWNPDLFMGVPLLANGQAGALYPLNWLFIGLSAPQAINYSIVLHVFLAGAFFFLFARDGLRLLPVGALVGACVYAFSGYVGSLVEHVNQLQAAAWFPVLLWCYERARLSQRLQFTLLGGLALAMQLLAGHAQVTYISLFGLGLWIIGGLYIGDLRLRKQPFIVRLKSLVSLLQYPIVISVIALGLSAIQLLPMLELSRLSIRAGGMTFREAVAFSLPLNKLMVALLPTYGFGEPLFSEYVAFVGVGALVLVLIGVAKRWREQLPLLLLLVAGLTLAVGVINPLYFVFYKLLPGFGLFRVPARWLFLYVFASAAFAGIGAQALDDGRRTRNERRKTTYQRHRASVLRPRTSVMVVVIVVELFLATRSLPYNQPTAPEAYAFMRPSIAYLDAQRDTQTARILSYSDLSWDPGDLKDIQTIFAGQLSPEAIYQYTVATKAKEIIAPNLAMRYHLQSVDGYDGGILPLARFVGLQSLFLTPQQVNPDGRLRERLVTVPDARWLDLFNVRYIIADKNFDVWVDGIFYDLGLGLNLNAGDHDAHSIDVPNDFVASGIGVISYLRGGANIANDTPLAEWLATDASSQVHRFTLRAGIETSESDYAASVAHAQARAVHTLRDQPSAHEYHALLNFAAPTRITSLSVRALQPTGDLIIHGISLVHQASATAKTLTFAPVGHFRLAQSGDIKLYEYTDVAPRALVVHRADLVADDADALKRMSQADFDTRAQIVLASGEPLQSDAPATAPTITSYEPERIVLTTNDASEGYLFLKDTWYPGWRAWVDGQPAPIERADTYFRAVQLVGGAHIVEFRFEPDSLRWGALTSALTLLVSGVVTLWMLRRPRSGSL